MLSTLYSGVNLMVCDYWECSHYAQCLILLAPEERLPCPFCVHWDMCDYCRNFVECAELVTHYLPNMFRRMVRDIRTGEDTMKTEQYINRNTLGGRKRGR